MTKGSGPNISLSYDGTKNRVSTSGYTYLSNGHLAAMTMALGGSGHMECDEFGHLMWFWDTSNFNESYSRGSDNRRVWKVNNNRSYEFEVHFYGAYGELIGRSEVSEPGVLRFLVIPAVIDKLQDLLDYLFNRHL